MKRLTALAGVIFLMSIAAQAAQDTDAVRNLPEGTKLTLKQDILVKANDRFFRIHEPSEDQSKPECILWMKTSSTNERILRQGFVLYTEGQVQNV